MGIPVAVRVLLIWLLMLLLAIGNGVFRDQLLMPTLGRALALPLSGLSLSVLLFVVVYLALPWLGKHTASRYILVGVQWLLMTLLFEFLFGHYVAGKAWWDILQVFDVCSGELFSLALLVVLVAPLTVAKLRSLL